MAIDWNDDGTCYCQNDCECMSDVGDDETYLITRDSRVGALPHECGQGCSLTGDLWSSPSGTTNHGNSDGWCYSELDQDVGCTESPRDCWETSLPPPCPHV